MKKLFLAFIIIVIVLLPVSADFITGTAGDDLYVIDNTNGNVLWRVKKGTVFPVNKNNSYYPFITETITNEQYGLIIDLKAKFTDNVILLHLDITKNEEAFNLVLQDLLRTDSCLTLKFYDQNNMLLTERNIDFSTASVARDSNDIPIRLSIDEITGGHEDIRNLVSSVSVDDGSIDERVRPAVPLFDIPDWLMGNWSIGFHHLGFTETDILLDNSSLRAMMAYERDTFTDSVDNDIYEVNFNDNIIKIFIVFVYFAIYI